MKVKELIEHLQQHPPEAEVAIGDADTEWELPVRVSYGVFGAYATSGRDGVVYLWGCYYDEAPIGAQVPNPGT